MNTVAGLDDGISDEQLNEDAEYNWSAEEDAYINVYDTGSLTQDGSFKAVYDVSGDDSIELYRPTITSDEPLEVRALKFRYDNGTYVNGTDLSVSEEDGRTVVDLPDDNENGKLAFTADAGSKQLRIETFVEGSYRVVLPPDHSANDFLLGHISPRNGYQTEQRGDRVHVVWQDVDSQIHLKYYVDRDRYLFYALVGSLTLVALGGYFVFNRQIRRLKERRREHGLELDGDDDEKRPPPGMG
jgi:hypothetical protein